MHAGHFDLRQGHYRTFEFAFESAAEIDMFGEFGGAQVGLVEQLEADLAGFGESQGRHGEPQFGQPGGWDQHGAADSGRR